MRIIYPILVFSGSTLLCFVFSFLFTFCVWEYLIVEGVFHCSDEGISIALWSSNDANDSASGTTAPVKTSDETRMVNGAFKITFYGLWLGGSVILFRVLYGKGDIP
jgi:hypothetical protein